MDVSMMSMGGVVTLLAVLALLGVAYVGYRFGKSHKSYQWRKALKASNIDFSQVPEYVKGKL